MQSATLRLKRVSLKLLDSLGRDVAPFAANFWKSIESAAPTEVLAVAAASHFV
jgi:hypothetical protein